MPLEKSQREIVVRVRTTRKTTEALRLELSRLAKRLGIPTSAIRVRRVGGQR